MKPVMQITLSGLRGGAGTTSLAAMLADTLRLLDQSVLVVDLNPSDLLRLHFNIPYDDLNGWAFGEENGSGWQQHTYKIDQGLWVLPYGRRGLISINSQNSVVNGSSVWGAITALQHLTRSYNHSQKAPTWVVFDVPIEVENYAALHRASDIHFLVSPPDIASHILLGQHQLLDNTKILINGLNTTQQLNEAVVLDWGMRYREQLAPVQLYQDSHIHEALAHKMPASSYFPDSSAAQSMHSLAMWCLTQRGERP